MLRNDGYRVTSGKASFSAEALASADILVVANARTTNGSAAFTPAEVAAVKAWVERGGSLLLVADHPPFSRAAATLGSAFGVTFLDGFPVKRGSGNGRADVFTRSNGGLLPHPITDGADGRGAISTLGTFNGSAFEAPAAEPLIRLGSGWLLIPAPDGGGTATSLGVPAAEGRLQGAALNQGRGRVIVLGEAAMLTAQRAANGASIGFGAPGAEENKRFLLSAMHWLSRTSAAKTKRAT